MILVAGALGLNAGPIEVLLEDVDPADESSLLILGSSSGGGVLVLLPPMLLRSVSASKQNGCFSVVAWN